MIQKITPISTTCLSPELEYGSELELELLPVSKENLDNHMLTTWHEGSVLKVLTKLKNIYSFVGEQVLKGGDWMYLTRGG